MHPIGPRNSVKKIPKLTMKYIHIHILMYNTYSKFYQVRLRNSWDSRGMWLDPKISQRNRLFQNYSGYSGLFFWVHESIKNATQQVKFVNLQLEQLIIILLTYMFLNHFVPLRHIQQIQFIHFSLVTPLCDFFLYKVGGYRLWYAILYV